MATDKKKKANYYHTQTPAFCCLLLVSFLSPPIPQARDESPRTRKAKNKALRRSAYTSRSKEEEGTVEAEATAPPDPTTEGTKSPGNIRKRYRALVEVSFILSFVFSFLLGLRILGGVFIFIFFLLVTWPNALHLSLYTGCHRIAWGLLTSKKPTKVVGVSSIPGVVVVFYYIFSLGLHTPDLMLCTYLYTRYLWPRYCIGVVDRENAYSSG